MQSEGQQSAGTTILQLVTAYDDRTKALLSDYGPAGLLEQGQRRCILRSRRIVLRDYGPEEAARSSCRAVGTPGPFRGPTTRPRDLPGAGRRVSPMLGILGQSFYTQIDRQDSGQVAKSTSD